VVLAISATTAGIVKLVCVKSGSQDSYPVCLRYSCLSPRVRVRPQISVSLLTLCVQPAYIQYSTGYIKIVTLTSAGP